jgi:hypothetical protein
MSVKLERRVRAIELLTFVTHVKRIIDEQQDGIEHADVRRGMYQFQDEFKHLEIQESTSFRMTKSQREKMMLKNSKDNTNTGNL